MKTENERLKLVLFTVYTLLYEFLIWGLVASAIHHLQWNEWTVLVGLFASSQQLRPKSFGLKYTKEENED